MDNFITQKVELILISPFEASPLTPVVARAVKAGFRPRPAVNDQRRDLQRFQPIVARRRRDDGRHLAGNPGRIIRRVVDAPFDSGAEFGVAPGKLGLPMTRHTWIPRAIRSSRLGLAGGDMIAAKASGLPCGSSRRPVVDMIETRLFAFAGLVDRPLAPAIEGVQAAAVSPRGPRRTSKQART